MEHDTSKHLPVAHWVQCLETGSMAKILKAIKNGQPMHPPSPEILDGGAPISPLALIYKWDWERKGKACMAALEGLIEAGADPNMADRLGRRPLHLALWLGREVYGIGPEPILALLKAGADPALLSATTPQTSEMSAFDVCLLKLDMKNSGREMLQLLLDNAPGAAGRCDPSPLMILAWNNSTLSDEQCRDISRMLMDGGADPDGGSGVMPRTPRQMPGRVRDFIREWEAEKLARENAARMDADTPTARPGTGSPRL